MPAVRYSHAQLRMLATLDLVPWVRREAGGAIGDTAEPVRDARAPGVSTVSAAAAPSAGAAASTPISSPAAASAPVPVGRAIDDRVPRRSGLAGRSLTGFARRGERRFDTGPDGAFVLVLAEPAHDGRAPERLPLAPADADLLQAMLRSIELGPGDHATALLAAESAEAAGADRGVDAGAGSDAPTVADRLAGRRVVLWLRHETDSAEPPEPAEHAIEGIPVFRLPHPALLLARPLAKRDAWRTLKRVRARLASPAGDGSASATRASR